ncbi:MAG: HAD-IC family P-type ATPase [Acidimicrobiales bacterium]
MLFETALENVEGVKWAEADPVLGQVIAEVAAGMIDVDHLATVIADVEAELGLGESPCGSGGLEHPGDREVVRRHALALGADVLGLGFGTLGRLLRVKPLPVELASLATVIDSEPRIRHMLESYLGQRSTDLGLAVANAVGQSLSQGSLGLLADGAHRVNLLVEAVARRSAFERLEQRRFGDGPLRTGTPPPVVTAPAVRPVPLPDGPVERYADRAVAVGALAGVATLAATRGPRRAAGVAVGAIPKGTRLGREAFAAHLDRALCERDMLVLDQRALRRLDRVDTVVFDSTLLDTGRWTVNGLRLLSGADPPEVHRHLSALFDPSHPGDLRGERRWTLGPPDVKERRRSAVRQARVDLGGGDVLVLRCGGHPVAVVGVARELSASVLHLIRTARLHGHMAVLTEEGPVPEVHVDADLVVAGNNFVDVIGKLQLDGHVVVLIAPGCSERVDALRAADVGLELCGVTGAQWAGHIVMNEVDDAAFVLDSIKSARDVSRQSVALSATASGLGALLAIGAFPGRAAGRAATAVNLAAVASMGNALRAVSYLKAHGGSMPADRTRWHELGADEVLRRLQTTVGGLTGQEAARRLRSSNSIKTPEPSLPRSILAELVNPLTPVLAAGAAASAAVGSPVDGGIIAAVSALNALVGGIQRFAAERAIVALSDVSNTWVTVLREGTVSQELSDRLVAGDVIVLRAGDAVPGDSRVLEAIALDVDESSLTGESDTVVKDPTATYSGALAERTSMLYEGTTIAAGNARAVVVAVGDATVANAALADLAAETPAVGVEARLQELTSLTLPVAGAAGAAVLGLGLLRGRTLGESVGSAVALAVAAVPEGLPVLATMAQLASARRLSRRQALVRNPRAIEALGRVKVLCTDKTGTLTEGRIRLRGVSDGRVEARVGDLPAIMRVVVAAGLRASPEPDGVERLPHLTDQAVVAGAALAKIGTEESAAGWTRVAELPFEPVRGYHAVLGATGKGQLLSVKGAPETIIPRCSWWASGAGKVSLGVAARGELDREVDRLARQGFRILAVAQAERPLNSELRDDDVAGLTLLGFLILADPVRTTAAAAVRELQAGGVDVLMVTGDHPSTAEGIAAELGILNGRRVVTGAQLASMSDTDLDEVIADVSVFARVTPADKVRVVLAQQRRGAPVAMTGDGANDAPAIALADVGIALGDRATPAARRAADLVVTDERIETIVDAIVEGRAMWASLREALAILLGGNLGEVAFTVAATALTGRAPLSARQLLVVNLLTDVAPALAIALRPPPVISSAALLAEGPDVSLGTSLERAIAVRASSTAFGAGIAWGAGRLTGRRRRAGTIALVALVGSQLGQTVTVGGKDPLVLLAGFGSAALLAGIVQTPGVSQFFGCTPLGPLAWSIAVSSSLLATAVSASGPLVLSLLHQPPTLSDGEQQR